MLLCTFVGKLKHSCIFLMPQPSFHIRVGKPEDGHLNAVERYSALCMPCLEWTTHPALVMLSTIATFVQAFVRRTLWMLSLVSAGLHSLMADEVADGKRRGRGSLGYFGLELRKVIGDEISSND